jgi:hypothetical protein
MNALHVIQIPWIDVFFDDLEKKHSLPSGENAIRISAKSAMEMIPGAKIVGVFPGGFCPKYGPLATAGLAAG